MASENTSCSCRDHKNGVSSSLKEILLQVLNEVDLLSVKVMERNGSSPVGMLSILLLWRTGCHCQTGLELTYLSAISS